MKLHTSLVFQRLIPIIHRFIPADLRQSPPATTHAENLLSSVLLAAIVIPFYGAFYLFLGDGINARFCFLAALGVLSIPMLLKWTHSTAIPCEAFNVVVYLLLIALTSRLGGVGAPTVIWFAVCPLIATAGAGARSGVIWSGLSLLAIVGIYTMDVMALFPPVVVNDMRLLSVVSTLSLVATVAVFLLIFERVNSNAILRLDQALSIIHDLAIRDELTGVFNRRELIRVAEREKARVDQHGSPFSLCLIDVDHFKNINDTYGHAAGDQVLKRVALNIQEDIRKTDCFGRYGGEEFLLLLVGTNAGEAQSFVERIRQRIEAMRFPELTDGRSVTISVGVAEYQNRETIEHTLSRADNALYSAKHEGRNCVVVSEVELQVS
ncbi:GGDEF domain-containing protein [Herbaspirillum sp. GCM10030257]|uniref:GGDEF domain-containing protein n=1 Tax=Herbaspirillum sp. GCM10030257 TaxID=3273393 RepID=UPI00360A9B6E